MEVFPDSALINPDFDIKTTNIWKTLITDFESGKEQRRKVWAFAKRRVTIPYGMVKDTEIKELWKFYQARSGAYDAFWFFFPMTRYIYGDYVATGDNSTVIFDLPSKSTVSSSETAYVDGTPTSVTLLTGGGQGSSDRIQFSVAPGNGAIITADFQGLHRLKARFELDELDDVLFKAALYATGITLLEVKG